MRCEGVERDMKARVSATRRIFTVEILVRRAPEKRKMPVKFYY